MFDKIMLVLQKIELEKEYSVYLGAGGVSTEGGVYTKGMVVEVRNTGDGEYVVYLNSLSTPLFSSDAELILQEIREIQERDRAEEKEEKLPKLNKFIDDYLRK